MFWVITCSIQSPSAFFDTFYCLLTSFLFVFSLYFEAILVVLLISLTSPQYFFFFLALFSLGLSYFTFFITWTDASFLCIGFKYSDQVKYYLFYLITFSFCFLFYIAYNFTLYSCTHINGLIEITVQQHYRDHLALLFFRPCHISINNCDI
jgi:hypothetical protein